MDYSPKLGIGFRWHEDCEVCTLCERVAVGHEMDGPDRLDILSNTAIEEGSVIESSRSDVLHEV